MRMMRMMMMMMMCVCVCASMCVLMPCGMRAVLKAEAPGLIY